MELFCLIYFCGDSTELPQYLGVRGYLKDEHRWMDGWKGDDWTEKEWDEKKKWTKRDTWTKRGRRSLDRKDYLWTKNDLTFDE